MLASPPAFKPVNCALRALTYDRCIAAKLVGHQGAGDAEAGVAMAGERRNLRLVRLQRELAADAAGRAADTERALGFTVQVAPHLQASELELIGPQDKPAGDVSRTQVRPAGPAGQPRRPP